MRAKRLTYSQVEFLCEQLAMILGSGMSVSEGLGLLCADYDDRVLVSACNEISSEVDRGEPLSQAMRSSGRFPEYADRKSTRLNSSHRCTSRMPSSA